MPSEATFECSETILYPNATAIDNCGEVDLIEEQEIIEGTNPGTYTIIRTFIATDDAGNSSSNSQTINIVDTVAPVSYTHLTLPTT